MAVWSDVDANVDSGGPHSATSLAISTGYSGGTHLAAMTYVYDDYGEYFTCTNDVTSKNAPAYSSAGTFLYVVVLMFLIMSLLYFRSWFSPPVCPAGKKDIGVQCVVQGEEVKGPEIEHDRETDSTMVSRSIQAQCFHERVAPQVWGRHVCTQSMCTYDRRLVQPRFKLCHARETEPTFSYDVVAR